MLLCAFIHFPRTPQLFRAARPWHLCCLPVGGGRRITKSKRFTGRMMGGCGLSWWPRTDEPQLLKQMRLPHSVEDSFLFHQCPSLECGVLGNDYVTTSLIDLPFAPIWSMTKETLKLACAKWFSPLCSTTASQIMRIEPVSGKAHDPRHTFFHEGHEHLKRWTTGQNDLRLAQGTTWAAVFRRSLLRLFP